jgi:large subunit ribosomal protein L18
MITKIDRKEIREDRHKRSRKNIFGTAERPRLAVFRSSKHIYAQVIDDENGTTLVSASTMEADVKGKVESSSNKEAAKLVGTVVAQKALAKGIESVVFDRGGFLYHGRIQELANGAREAGLQF